MPPSESFYEKLHRLTNPASLDLVNVTAGRLVTSIQDECRDADIEIGPIKTELVYKHNIAAVFVACYAQILNAKGREVISSPTPRDEA